MRQTVWHTGLWWVGRAGNQSQALPSFVSCSFLGAALALGENALVLAYDAERLASFFRHVQLKLSVLSAGEIA